MRPQIRAGRKPGRCISTGRVHDEPRAYRPHASVKPMPSLRACRARPSTEWASDARKALRGKPRDNVEVGFLGGTHSVRPRSMAFRMPGHLIATRSVAERPGGLPVTCLGQARAILAGVRSPPLLEGQAWVRGLAGENPGMALRGVFSEQLSPSFLGQLPHYAPCPELTVDIGARTLASLGKLWIVATEVTVSNLKFLAHGHGFLIRMSPALHLSPSGENPSLLSELIAGGTSGQRSSSPVGDIDAPKG